eukprot:TRINITY_DN50_c0_g1_i1.p1 TRINITY_DN50_c0_g1~~TRINITY_DN50_c0_g1_i1.p1  ORF type:complete len:427 (-),score=99.49 TRINITY_DN50_c0_g1_i1:249-1529(-)
MGKKKGKTMTLTDFLGAQPVEEVAALPTRPLNEVEREQAQKEKMVRQQRRWGDVENPGFDERSSFSSASKPAAEAAPSPADGDDWRRDAGNFAAPAQGQSRGPNRPRFASGHDDRQPVAEAPASDPFMEQNWRDAPKVDQFAGVSQAPASRFGSRDGDNERSRGPRPVETGPSQADGDFDWRSAPRIAPTAQTSDAPPRRQYDNAPREGGRGYAPREGGRDFAPREGGRGYAPREGGRDFAPREGGRGYAPREGGRDFAPREGGRDFAPREGGRGYAPREGGRDFAPREGGRDFAPREGDRERGPRTSGFLAPKAADAAEADNDNDWRSAPRVAPAAVVEEPVRRTYEGGPRGDQQRSAPRSFENAAAPDNRERPRLNIAPRSSGKPSTDGSGSSKGRSDPFGGARPREDNIRGRDVPAVESGNAQ